VTKKVVSVFVRCLTTSSEGAECANIRFIYYIADIGVSNYQKSKKKKVFSTLEGLIFNSDSLALKLWYIPLPRDNHFQLLNSFFEM
jgi:hypothetical protein